MTSSKSTDSKRTNQVKVNLNDYELNELLKYVSASRSDRSSVLRNTFLNWKELLNTVSEVKAGIERVQSDANKSYTPLYKCFPRSLKKLTAVKNALNDLKTKKSISILTKKNFKENFNNENADLVISKNIQAEKAVLGGILLDPEAIGRIANLIKPEAFYINSHQEIYRVALMLYRQGKPTDLTSMSAWLSENGSLENIGGNNKLVQLIEDVSSTASIEQDANLINDKFKGRQLIRSGDEAEDGEYTDVGKNIIELLEEAIEDIFNAQQVLFEADEEYHSQLFDYLKILGKSINNKTPELKISNKNEDIFNENNKEIKILEISNAKQKYELIDQLNKGSSIISKFKNIKGEIIEKTMVFEFIMGGVYAIEARQEKLSDSMYLFSPKEINIDKLSEDLAS